MVSCAGHPPSEGATQILFLPEMLVTKAIDLPSRAHVLPPMNRVLYSFSIDCGCTSRVRTLLSICFGPVIACGTEPDCAESADESNTTSTMLSFCMDSLS